MRGKGSSFKIYNTSHNILVFDLLHFEIAKDVIWTYVMSIVGGIIYLYKRC